MTQEDKTILVCCPSCDKETYCSIDYYKKIHTSDDDCGIWYDDHYYVLRCNGCRNIFFFHSNQFSENDIDKDGYLIPTEHIYPMPKSKREAVHNKNVDIHNCLMNDILFDSYASILYKEICEAINGEQYIIGMFGIRSLLSEVCRMKTGFNKTFTANLDKLVEEGYLAIKQRDVFKTIIDIGNDTVHEPKIPSKETLRLCLLTIESLIVSLFIVPQHENKLKKVAPPPKEKKASTKPKTSTTQGTPS